MRGSVWVRAIATTAAAFVAALGCGASASAVGITGFAYQDRGDYSELGQFYERGLNLSQARLIVPWDAANQVDEMADIVRWVRAAEARGRRVLISFNHRPLSDSTPPVVGDYGTAVQAFRNQLPEVPEYSAWNEPNHHPSYAPDANPADVSQAPLAAQYWKKLNNICHTPINGQTCVVAAGDFHDPTPTDHSVFDSYVAAYKAELASGVLAADPTVWAIHPYKATNSQDFSAVTSWINNQTGSADVWLTEVGAMYCVPRPTGATIGGGYTGPDGVEHTPATALVYQNDVAAALKTALAQMPTRATRTYYYTLGWHDGNPDTCDDADHAWDSALLGAGDAERAAFRTLFPAAPHVQSPDVVTNAATAVSAISASLNGRVTPHGLNTSYYFDYGTTTAYGASVPVPSGSAGAGSNPVSATATVAGLQADTTYHYRVVASSRGGTTYGADQTFETGHKGRPATTIAPDGTELVYFRDTNGGISQLQWDAAGDRQWHLTPLGGSAVGDPTLATLSDGTQLVYFRGTNNSLWQWQWGPSDRIWHLTQLQGQTAGDPVAVSAPDTTQLVYFRDTSGGISQLQWDAAGDRQWHLTPLGGSAVGDPTLTTLGDGTQLVYFRGRNNSLWQWMWTAYDRTWHLSPLQGQAAGDPVAVSAPDTTQLVYFRDTNGGISQLQWDAAGDRQWHLTPLGGSAVGDPALGTLSDGTQLVYFRGPNNSLSQWMWTPAERIWHLSPLQGQATGDPVAVIAPDTTQLVFYADANGQVAQLQWDAAGDRQWHVTPLGGQVAG